MVTSGAMIDDINSIMTVCTPQTGSVLPSDLVMSAGGTDDTGAKCSAVFQYTVGA